ncbi:MAG: hypothetical protein QM754_19115 [Tepidisphaeraceae bacterium]
MHSSNLVENLESRELLAAQLTVGPNNIYFNAVKGSTQTYEVRITNSGDQRVVIDRLAIKGDNASYFKVLDFPSTGRSLGVGAQVKYTVQFTAPTGTTDFQNAVLRVMTQTIPSRNGFSNVVPLRGMPTNGTSGSSEPSLQKVFDLYNLPIKSGETDADNYHFPTTQPTDTDEITSWNGTFTKAGTGDVTITPMAVFTNASSPAVRMGFYTPGDEDSAQYMWYVPGDTAQSVNPYYYGVTKFDPGTAEFGLLTQYPNFVNTDKTVRNVYSENTLNSAWSDSSSYTHFRIYPFINQAGEVVPNAYIVAEEEYEVTSVADNQDLVFIVTNVNLAGTSPTLSVENKVAYPDNSTLVFNEIGTKNADVTNLVRSTNSVIVRNTGKGSMTINSSVTGDYSITSGGGAATIAPGASRTITVTFTASSGTAIHYGTLTITSNDPNNPSKAINLIGQWQQYSEQAGPSQPSVEPSAGRIVNDLFGYQTTIPDSLSGLNNGASTSTYGDEINAQYFTAADTSAAVTIVELATFHNQTYVNSDGDTVGTNSYMGWYTKGNTGSYTQVIRDKVGTGQMILPTPDSSMSNASTGITAGSFRPGTGTFGFVVEKRTADSTGGGGEYSDYSLNTFNADDPSTPKSAQKFLRFFPVRDSDGVLIPNTYIVLHDYNRLTTNYDFNDNVYLISNIVPEGAVKQAPTVYAYANSDGVRVNWTSPVDGAKITGFNVYRSTTAAGTYTLLNDAPINARPSNFFQDDSAVDGTTYYYAIESVGQSGAKSYRTMVKVTA